MIIEKPHVAAPFHILSQAAIHKYWRDFNKAGTGEEKWRMQYANFRGLAAINCHIARISVWITCENQYIIIYNFDASISAS